MMVYVTVVHLRQKVQMLKSGISRDFGYVSHNFLTVIQFSNINELSNGR